MKENSIEEDRINNAYCFLNSMHSDFRTGLYYKEDLENLEHILSDYKRVQKELEELKIIKSAIQTLQINSIEDEKYIVISKSSFLDGSYKHLLDEYIPIQEVKDKIKELEQQDREWTEELSEPDSNFKNIDRNLKRIKNQVAVLQELLERNKTR